MRETQEPEWTPLGAASPVAARESHGPRRGDDEPSDLPVIDVLANVEELVEPIARSRNVVWLVTTGTTASIQGDRRQVCQVVVNLALHAVHAASTHRGGRVIVSAAEGDGDCIRLSVRHTGPGFAEPRRGLDAARRVVERSGGRMSVERSAVGTRVLVELPCAPAA